MTTSSAPISKPDSSWTTSSTINEVVAAARRASRVLITTHTKPDGDALGSTLALYRSLRHAGVRAETIWAGPIPRWAGAISADSPFIELHPGKPCQPVRGLPPVVTDSDLLMVVDTGSWGQVAEMKPLLENRSAQTIVIDHHLQGDSDMATRRLLEKTAASCTQALADVCTQLCGVSSAAQLPTDVAEPLYLGLATDTGWFRYSSVTPATLRLAADLIAAGVDHTKLYRFIEQQEVITRYTLLGRALSGLQLHSVRGHEDVATMILSDQDFLQTGADRTETGGFADQLLAVSTVEVSVLLVESPPVAGELPLTKFSLRSKPGTRAVDVNVVAQQLGGGGHARAAGAKSHRDLPGARSALLDALKAVMQ